jgi:hypothetical protein
VRIVSPRRRANPSLKYNLVILPNFTVAGARMPPGSQIDSAFNFGSAGFEPNGKDEWQKRQLVSWRIFEHQGNENNG